MAYCVGNKYLVDVNESNENEYKRKYRKTVKETVEETYKDTNNDTQRDSYKKTYKDSQKDTNNDIFKDTQKQNFKNHQLKHNNYTQDFSQFDRNFNYQNQKINDISDSYWQYYVIFGVGLACGAYFLPISKLGLGVAAIL